MSVKSLSSLLMSMNSKEVTLESSLHTTAGVRLELTIGERDTVERRGASGNLLLRSKCRGGGNEGTEEGRGLHLALLFGMEV